MHRIDDAFDKTWPKWGTLMPSLWNGLHKFSNAKSIMIGCKFDYGSYTGRVIEFCRLKLLVWWIVFRNCVYFFFRNENNDITFWKRYYFFLIFEKEGKVEYGIFEMQFFFFLSLNLNNYRIRILEGIRFFLIRYNGGLRVNSCHLING